MKHGYRLACLLLCAVLCVGVLCACPAQEEPEPVYCTLTFDSQGGTELAPQRVQKDTAFSLAGYVPVREGYQFAGWSTTDASGDRMIYMPDGAVVVRGDMTLYADWEPLSRA